MKEKQTTVAYCGTRGSFGEIAASKLFPNGKLLPCATFKEAYELARSGEAESALLPIENSYAGEVAATLELLYRGDLLVSDLYEMKIEQNLVGVKGTSLDDVKTVISHPQALAQCAEYIAAHKFGEVVSENTAFAAKTVADKGSKALAAIASRACADLYGLEVIAADIAEGGARRGSARWRDELVAKAVARSYAGASTQLTPEAAVKLVEELANAKMPYVCPRGKPVMVYRSNRDIARSFGRHP